VNSSLPPAQDASVENSNESSFGSQVEHGGLSARSAVDDKDRDKSSPKKKSETV
jgi:hypothetical protein